MTALWLAALIAVPRIAAAGGGPPTDAYEGVPDDAPITLRALAELYVREGDAALRAFDRTGDAPAIGWLRAEVARAPGPVGFRLDLTAGDAAAAYLDGDPAQHTHPDLERALSHVTQAFATVVAGGVAIDAGKFDTPIGLEDNEPDTNWNHGRSFLYTFAEPTVHVGVRATYAVAPALVLAAFWLNGWNANLFDGSAMRSGALAARWKPHDDVELVLVYAGGLERSPRTAGLARRDALDAYAIYHPWCWLDLAVTGDYVADHALGGARLYGAAAYARAELGRYVAVAARAERLADPDGFATATPQTLTGWTATIEGHHHLAGFGVQGRLEVRRDTSTAPALAAGRTAQDTLTLALIATW